jgi:hypothetical protein
MQELCTNQLLEHGRKKNPVSERSIREDIRVMRSDALDFNAPIVVKNGVYSYSDENYSIFNTSIDDMELLKEVTFFLLENYNDKNTEKLKAVLNKLSEKTGITLPQENKDTVFNISDEIPNCYNHNFAPLSESIESFFITEKKETSLFGWNDILKAI